MTTLIETLNKVQDIKWKLAIQNLRE